MKLYRVTLTYEMVVCADNEADATEEAQSWIDDEEPESDAAEIGSKRNVPHGWLDAFPYGSDIDCTVADILDGVPQLPPPDAPGSLDAIGEWLALRTHHMCTNLREEFCGESTTGWRWWTDGQAMLVLASKDERPDCKPLNLLDAPRPYSATIAIADLDAMIVDIDRDKPTAVRFGAAFVDARLLRRWVWGVARAAGSASIGVAWNGDRDGVHFDGEGWSAIVMPVRWDQRDPHRVAA